MTGDRVLVTGATGFVGHALVDHLVERGTAITVAVRREIAVPAGVRVVRIADISPETSWDDALTGCKTVVHLAARVHVMRETSNDPLADFRRVNVGGTVALATQAAAAGVRRLVYVSSIKVNGESSPNGRPFRESDSPAPTDPYGISKLEAEKALFEVSRSTGLEIVVVRPPLVYGPGVKANFLAMTKWLARGVPLPLGALRENRRSLVGLDNLVDLLRVCLDHPKAAAEVFLVSDGKDVSTSELLERSARAMGMRARLVPIPPAILRAVTTVTGRAAMFQRLNGNLYVDISKARTLLGWNPPFSMDEELGRTVRASVGAAS